MCAFSILIYSISYVVKIQAHSCTRNLVKVSVNTHNVTLLAANYEHRTSTDYWISPDKQPVATAHKSYHVTSKQPAILRILRSPLPKRLRYGKGDQVIVRRYLAEKMFYFIKCVFTLRSMEVQNWAHSVEVKTSAAGMPSGMLCWDSLPLLTVESWTKQLAVELTLCQP
jgi:hypothetical protein